MIAVSLALVAALAYGVSDFLGGVLSTSRSSWTVAWVSQLTAALATVVVALVFLPGDPQPADFAWAAAGGVGEAVGIGALYRGLSQGRMGVVAPVSGVGAALVPVVVGLVTGDQPSPLAWVGIAVAFPAVYLIPQSPDRAPDADRASTRAGVANGILAGVGFGAQFALVGQIGAGSGLFPIALLWLVSAATVILTASALRQPWLPRRGSPLAPVFAFGPISALAVVSFLLATGQGMLTTVSVIAALYPAVTVGMAAVVLRERVGRWQAVGLGLAVAAVVLVTLGR